MNQITHPALISGLLEGHNITKVLGDIVYSYGYSPTTQFITYIIDRVYKRPDSIIHNYSWINKEEFYNSLEPLILNYLKSMTIQRNYISHDTYIRIGDDDEYPIIDEIRDIHYWQSPLLAVNPKIALFPGFWASPRPNNQRFWEPGRNPRYALFDIPQEVIDELNIPVIETSHDHLFGNHVLELPGDL